MYLIKKKINRKIKEFRENYKHVRFYEGEDAVIFLELKNSTKVRTYLNLIFRIKESYNYPIVIKFSLFRYFVLSKWFEKLDYIYFSKPLSKLVIYRLFSHSNEADFKINYNYKKVYSSDNYISNVVPYIMHPSNYILHEEVQFEKFIGIVISGNFEEKIYSSNAINSNFKVLNRWEIYNEIVKHPNLVEITGSELMNYFGSKHFIDKFVLMKWQNGAIPTEKWRFYLSTSKFMFCAPGMTMPLCHNVLEAISVGVIPIINYQNWLNPSMEDKVNCLIYNNQDDIQKVIDFALQMEDSVVLQMSNNVKKYYDLYYSKYDFEANINLDLIVVNENLQDLL